MIDSQTVGYLVFLGIPALLVGRQLRNPIRIGFHDARTAEMRSDESIGMRGQKLARNSAAHRVAADVRLVDLQIIHQLDCVGRFSRAVQRRLVALAVIAIIERHHAVIFRQRLSDAVAEPIVFRIAGVTMDQHHPGSFTAERQVVNLHAIGGGEESIFGNVFARGQSRGRGEHERCDQDYSAFHFLSP